MRHTLKIAVLAAAGLLLPLLASAEGEIYRWKDANGTWHYSDQPHPGAELVKSARKPPGATTAPARAAVPAPAAAASGNTLPPPPVSDAVAV